MIRALVTVWYFFAAAIISVVMFVAMLIIVAVTGLWDRERVSLNYVSHLYARLLFWANPLWKVTVLGRENVDSKENYVVTGNHQSMLDIPLLYFLPWRMKLKWVARKGIYKWFVFGQILWLQNNITVDKESKGATREEVVRSAKKFFRRGKSVLSSSWSVVIFPEGTRSQSGNMGEFEAGAFKLAADSGVKILPVAIDDIRGFMAGGRIVRHRVVLSILPPIESKSAKELQELDRELISNELEVLRNDKRDK